MPNLTSSDLAHLRKSSAAKQLPGNLALRLIATPISLATACAFVKERHRHHQPPQGGKFAIGASINGKLVGVVIAGRPTARNSDDGRTGEVTRLCTDGTPNACSFLYARARRAMQQMGYERFITFVLDSETGGSVAADGWTFDGFTGGGSWHRDSRPREDKHPTVVKRRFVARIGGAK